MKKITRIALIWSVFITMASFGLGCKNAEEFTQTDDNSNQPSETLPGDDLDGGNDSPKADEELKSDNNSDFISKKNIKIKLKWVNVIKNKSFKKKISLILKPKEKKWHSKKTFCRKNKKVAWKKAGYTSSKLKFINNKSAQILKFQTKKSNTFDIGVGLSSKTNVSHLDYVLSIYENGTLVYETQDLTIKSGKMNFDLKIEILEDRIEIERIEKRKSLIKKCR